MDQNKLVKMSSITKKICVALLGGFLLIFLLVHASANLCIIRDDGGRWYTDFCHFFGSNYVIKVFEVILIAAILCHICLTVMLQLQNWKARGTERYHVKSKTKTATGSKLMIWTGILIFCFLVMHFTQFWLVKMNVVDGQYMVKSEEVQKILQKSEAQQIQSAYQIAQTAVQYKQTPSDMFDMQMDQMKQEMAAMGADSTKAALMPQYQEYIKQMEDMKSEILPMASVLYSLMNGDKYTHGLSVEDRDALIAADANFEEAIEPDFYMMARDLFKNPFMVLIYLITFVVLWFHMRHAFESAFQTLGWNNLKYHRAIEIVAVCYAWLICLMFAMVPLYVLLLM